MWTHKERRRRREEVVAAERLLCGRNSEKVYGMEDSKGLLKRGDE